MIRLRLAATGALLVLAGYLAKHPTRLGYAKRLADGRTIGSGLVEGSVKQLVNLRLKRSGARWREEHVGPLVELIALADSPDCGRAGDTHSGCGERETASDGVPHVGERRLRGGDLFPSRNASACGFAFTFPKDGPTQNERRLTPPRVRGRGVPLR